MSSFRDIRPSQGDTNNLNSHSSRSTSESTGSDLQHGRDKRLQVAGTPSKRRRVPENVTRNACLNCKKARAKCDGQKPCSRCSSRPDISPCIYELHVKHAKEELVRQIKELKERDQKLENILHALSSNDHVPEILQRLRNGQSYDAIAEYLGQFQMDGTASNSPQPSQISAFGTPDGESASLRSSALQWTTVTADSAIVEHLFQLYFAWIHPVHTLFSETHFIECYKNRTSEYCSSALVNAICGLACHLHTPDDSDETDFDQLEASFSDALRSMIDPDDKDLCTTQAFAIMYLIDCARGQCLKAAPYLSIASGNLSEVVIQDIPDFLLVVHDTTQGIRCLNVEWAQLTFQIPHLSLIGSFQGTSEQMERVDNGPWYFYRYIMDQCPSWPALLATTNREKYKLTEINKDVTAMLYGPPGQDITAQMLLHQYNRYLRWREELPSSIAGFESNDSQPLPHVLSLLILYSTSVILLLRPLLNLPGFPAAMVEGIVWTNAQEGLFLLDRHYRTRYTCRYQPVLQMFSLLQLCDTIFRYFPDKIDESTMNGRDAITFGIEALLESQTGFAIGGPLQAMLRRSAEQVVGRQLKQLDDIFSAPSGSEYSMDDFIDTYTRPSYLQPVADIRQKYATTFIEDWKLQAPALSYRPSGIEVRWRRFSRSDEERGTQNSMRIRNLLNDG